MWRIDCTARCMQLNRGVFVLGDWERGGMRRRGNAAQSNFPVAFPSRSLQGLSFLFLAMAQVTIRYMTTLLCGCSKMPSRKIERRFRTIAAPKLAARRVRSAGLLQSRKTRISFESISVEGYE
jgi:hypothetical protein